MWIANNTTISEIAQVKGAWDRVADILLALGRPGGLDIEVVETYINENLVDKYIAIGYDAVKCLTPKQLAAFVESAVLGVSGQRGSLAWATGIAKEAKAHLDQNEHVEIRIYRE